jgi:hypothetical protein
VDITPASGMRRPGFESRPGIRFLGNCLCVERRNIGIGHNNNIFLKRKKKKDTFGLVEYAF